MKKGGFLLNLPFLKPKVKCRDYVQPERMLNNNRQIEVLSPWMIIFEVLT